MLPSSASSSKFPISSSPSPLRYWTGFGSVHNIFEKIPEEARLILLENLRNGEHKSLSTCQKFRVTSAGQSWVLYSLKLNVKSRVLFTIFQSQCILLDYLPDHEYDHSAMMDRDYFIKMIKRMTAGWITIEPISEECDPKAEEIDIDPSASLALDLTPIWFDRSFITLDEDQSQVHNLTSWPVIFQGPPGGGKTFSERDLILRTAFDALERDPESTVSITYAAKPRALVRREREWFEQQDLLSDPRLHLNFFYRENLYPSFTGSLAPWSKQDSLRWIAKYLGSSYSSIPLTETQVFLEFSLLFALNSDIAAYESIRGHQDLTAQQRESLHSLYHRFFGEILENNVLVEGFKCFDVFEGELQDLITLDEGQLYTIPEVLYFLAHAKERRLLIAKDAKQNPEWAGSDPLRFLAPIVFEMQGISMAPPTTLHKNYRSDKAVLELANTVLSLENAVLGGVAVKGEPTSLSIAPERAQGCVRWYHDVQSEEFSAIRSKLPLDSYDWAVITPSRHYVKAKAIFGEQALVLTQELVPGMEFKVVVLYRCVDREALMKAPPAALSPLLDDTFTPNPRLAQDTSTMIATVGALKALFTTITRAKNGVLIIEPPIARGDKSNKALKSCLAYLQQNPLYHEHSAPFEIVLSPGNLEGWVPLVARFAEEGLIDIAIELFHRHIAGSLTAPMTFAQWCEAEEIALPRALQKPSATLSVDTNFEECRAVASAEALTSGSLKAESTSSTPAKKRTPSKKFASPKQVLAPSELDTLHAKLLKKPIDLSKLFGQNRQATADLFFALLFEKNSSGVSFYELCLQRPDRNQRSPYLKTLSDLTSYKSFQEIFFTTDFFSRECPKSVLDRAQNQDREHYIGLEKVSLFIAMIATTWSSNPEDLLILSSLLLKGDSKKAVSRAQLLKTLYHQEPSLNFLLPLSADDTSFTGVLELLELKKTVMNPGSFTSMIDQAFKPIGLKDCEVLPFLLSQLEHLEKKILLFHERDLYSSKLETKALAETALRDLEMALISLILREISTKSSFSSDLDLLKSKIATQAQEGCDSSFEFKILQALYTILRDITEFGMEPSSLAIANSEFLHTLIFQYNIPLNSLDFIESLYHRDLRDSALVCLTAPNSSILHIDSGLPMEVSLFQLAMKKEDLDLLSLLYENIKEKSPEAAQLMLNAPLDHERLGLPKGASALFYALSLKNTALLRKFLEWDIDWSWSPATGAEEISLTHPLLYTLFYQKNIPAATLLILHVFMKKGTKKFREFFAIPIASVNMLQNYAFNDFRSPEVIQYLYAIGAEHQMEHLRCCAKYHSLSAMIPSIFAQLVHQTKKMTLEQNLLGAEDKRDCDSETLNVPSLKRFYDAIINIYNIALTRYNIESAIRLLECMIADPYFVDYPVKDCILSHFFSVVYISDPDLLKSAIVAIGVQNQAHSLRELLALQGHQLLPHFLSPKKMQHHIELICILISSGLPPRPVLKIVIEKEDQDLLFFSLARAKSILSCEDFSIALREALEIVLTQRYAIECLEQRLSSAVESLAILLNYCSEEYFLNETQSDPGIPPAPLILRVIQILSQAAISLPDKPLHPSLTTINRIWKQFLMRNHVERIGFVIHNARAYGVPEQDFGTLVKYLALMKDFWPSFALPISPITAPTDSLGIMREGPGLLAGPVLFSREAISGAITLEGRGSKSTGPGSKKS